DVDGREFIDFAGGLGVLNVGHVPPEVVRAIQEQAARYLHTCFSVMMYEPYVQLARELCERVPGDFPKKTMFTNSGAEAVENAVKAARAYTGKQAVIVFEYGFHGRTLLTMAMTSKVKPYKFGFGTLAPNVHRAPYAYCYRCPLGKTYPSCNVACADTVADMFNTHVDPDEVAALVVEPVAGEGGFIVPPPEWLQRLSEICRQRGVVFVADEVQSGIGRTGKMFAVEHAGVAPDMLTSAKSLAAGVPLGAVTGRAEIMDAPIVGGLGGTYGGNPLACVAGLEVLAMIDRDRLLDRSREIGKRMMTRFQAMREKHPLIGDVRGLGAMVAIELVSDREKRTPAKEQTSKVIKKAYERGLLLLKAGVHDNVVRTLVPLVADDRTIDDGLDIIDDCLAAVGAEMTVTK
ncbi:MAG: 4-aminobutyrate--2-oxoglutarate transaminase, partial [Proteobacteria bacterium]|nr:4-aminobutyrate--2-oxoglutarate transaminase [Pseudomonadota bacterium]